MQRLTKEEMKNLARTGLLTGYVLGEFEGSPIDWWCEVLFPSQIEDYFPTHRDAIIAIRSELQTTLIQSFLPGNADNFLNAIIIAEPYLAKVHNLCGKEAYYAAIPKSSFVQELRATFKHNSKMNKKLQEYQQRACGACGKLGPWKRCSRCRQIHYCKTECQKSHWPSHKVHCKKQSKDKLESKSTQETKKDGVYVQPVDPPGCFVIVDDPVIYLAPDDHPIMTKFKAKYGEPIFRYVHDGTTYNTMSEEEYFGCKD